MPNEFLHVENFAQIRKAEIEFGDLTVLVGPQATGKSLLLQLLKLALDDRFVVSMMKGAGLVWDTSADLVGRYLGEGMESAWSDVTRVRTHRGILKPEEIRASRKKQLSETVFYIPAHRALLLTEGWPMRFERFKEDTPIVARLFSDALFGLLTSRKAADLFPWPNKLKEPLREIIDDAIFHGGKVRLAHQDLRQRRLEILYGEGAHGFPFPSWTAGQREFTPLLLGLYSVIPGAHVPRREPLEWVIIEEPEMGLHPRAIEVVMLLVLELLKREYKVVLSTHSPIIVEVVWGLNRLRASGGDEKSVLDVFQVRRRQDMTPLAQRALEVTSRVFSLDYEDDKVVSRDISPLDPGSSNRVEAFWGGLTEFSARIENAVASAHPTS